MSARQGLDDLRSFFNRQNVNLICRVLALVFIRSINFDLIPFHLATILSFSLSLPFWRGRRWFNRNLMRMLWAVCGYTSNKKMNVCLDARTDDDNALGMIEFLVCRMRLHE